MQDTVASIAQHLTETQPGWHLAPARIGKPGSQADVVVPCPNFCAEDHIADWNHHAVDLDHWGPNDANWDTDSITDPGYAGLTLSARLYLDPNSSDPRLSAANIRMDDGTTDVFLTPDMADEAADGLIAFAAKLRNLARQGRAFNASTGRQPRTWQSLTRDDLTNRPISYLLKVFGVGVVEAEVESVALHGEPGSMELHVLPDVPQCLREDLARRALLAWFDARVGGDV